MRKGNAVLTNVEENDEGSVETATPPSLSRRFCRMVRRVLGTILFYRTPRIVLGIALLIAGLAGLVLPILQGVVLIVAALAILRKDIPFVATIWDRFVVPLQLRYRRWRNARRCR